MDAVQREDILARYREHSRRFQTVAARLIPVTDTMGVTAPGDRPAREIEVLQLVSVGLVHREIGDRLFLSEETVESHVRHLLAKLQARSRAHAVAVGFRRGLLA